MTGTCNVSIYVTRSKSLYSPIRLPPSFPPSFSLSFFHPPSIGRLLSQYRVCVYKLSGPRIHINHGCWSCVSRCSSRVYSSFFISLHSISLSLSTFLPVSPISSPAPLPVFPPPEKEKGKSRPSHPPPPLLSCNEFPWNQIYPRCSATEFT